MKAFSNEEKVAIKKSLTEACLHCWGVFGFSKTSVGQLCEMVGISVGAFYKLFESKEHLFYESAGEYELAMFRQLEAHLKDEPNKFGFIRGMQAAIKTAMESVWFYQINIDMQKITRKINIDMKKETQNIFIDLYLPLFEKYNIKLKRSLDEAMVIITLLFGGILFKEILPIDIKGGMDFIVESTISALVE